VAQAGYLIAGRTSPAPAATSPNIADGLQAVDPAHADRYAEHAAVYDKQLAALDAWTPR